MVSAFRKVKALLGLGGGDPPRSAYYVTRKPDWVRSRTETLTIEDILLVRRHLTLDVVLPDPAAAVGGGDGGEHQYLIPVTLIDKERPVPNLSARDEQGSSLPFLTPYESVLQSAQALLAAVEGATGHPPTEEMKTAVKKLALEFEDRDIARDHHADLVALAEESGPKGSAPLATRKVFPHLKQASLDLVTRWSLWVYLSGSAGRRRVVEVEYDFLVFKPRLFSRPDRRAEASPRTLGARLFSRFSTSMGWAAIDFYVPDPRLRNVDSYLLEVPAPPGLEVRGVRLLAELTKEGKPLMPRSEQWTTGARLHFANAVVEKRGPAVISLRAGRRGFISLATLTIFVIATLLWAYEQKVGAVNSEAEQQVAAAVLLVVPAFLGFFVVRPGEHPLTARLASGVRLLVLLTGLLSVAAGAALAGVRPGDWSVGRTWHLYAILSTIAATAIAITWVASLEPVWARTRRLRQKHRNWGLRNWKYRLLVAAAMGMLAACVTLSAPPSSADDLERWLTIGWLVVGVSATAWAALLAEYSVEDVPSPFLRAVVFVVSVAAAGAVAIALTPLRGTLLDPIWEHPWRVAIGLGLLTAISVGLPFRAREADEQPA